MVEGDIDTVDEVREDELQRALRDRQEAIKAGHDSAVGVLQHGCPCGGVVQEHISQAQMGKERRVKGHGKGRGGKWWLGSRGDNYGGMMFELTESK